MPKLSDKSVETLKPATDEYVVWDSEVTGFGVRVQRTGSKSFVLVYRLDGKKRKHTMGRVDDSHDVKEARDLVTPAGLEGLSRPISMPQDLGPKHAGGEKQNHAPRHRAGAPAAGHLAIVGGSSKEGRARHLDSFPDAKGRSPRDVSDRARRTS